MWIASGYCDMCKGMQGLALLVQEGLGRDPFLCVDRDYVAEPSRAPAEACQNLEFSATYFLPLGRVRDPPAPLFRRDNMLEFYFSYRGCSAACVMVRSMAGWIASPSIFSRSVRSERRP